MQYLSSILLIESDQIRGKALVKIILFMGINPIQVDNALDAILQLEENIEIVAVVIDADMPKLNNFGIVEWIKKNRSEVMIIILTSETTNDLSFYKYNPAAILRMPFSTHQLRYLLNRHGQKHP